MENMFDLRRFLVSEGHASMSIDDESMKPSFNCGDGFKISTYTAILTERLYMHRLAAKLVQRLLTDDQIENHINITKKNYHDKHRKKRIYK